MSNFEYKHLVDPADVDLYSTQGWRVSQVFNKGMVIVYLMERPVTGGKTLLTEDK